MKLPIKFLSLLLALTFFTTNDAANAESNVDPHSISINGELIQGDDNIPVTKEDNSIIQPLSTITYPADGYVANSAKFTNRGYVNMHKHFHNTSVTLPTGTAYKYTWERTVEKTSTKTSNWSVGVSGSGGVKFLTEVEGSYSYGRATSKTLKITQGSKSETSITQPGTYQLDFYMKGIYWEVNGKWKAYTIDKPNVATTVDRYLGYIIEPTDFLHLEITKK
ncbi:MAG: hypothetical protein ABS935_16740 [Solibacillus sp.]|uniref:hypothetical protein n=1 Tax=Solibacillus sp. TaxID=1909654 RepID=UPI003315266C